MQRLVFTLIATTLIAPAASACTSTTEGSLMRAGTPVPTNGMLWYYNHWNDQRLLEVRDAAGNDLGGTTDAIEGPLVWVQTWTPDGEVPLGTDVEVFVDGELRDSWTANGLPVTEPPAAPSLTVAELGYSGYGEWCSSYAFGVQLVATNPGGIEVGSYIFEVADDPDFTAPVRHQRGWASTQFEVTPGELLWYRVQALNWAGEGGDWSEAIEFAHPVGGVGGSGGSGLAAAGGSSGNCGCQQTGGVSVSGLGLLALLGLRRRRRPAAG